MPPHIICESISLSNSFSPFPQERLFQKYQFLNGSIYLLMIFFKFLLYGTHLLRSYYSTSPRTRNVLGEINSTGMLTIYLNFYIPQLSLKLCIPSLQLITNLFFSIEHWMWQKLLSYISLILQLLSCVNDYALPTVHLQNKPI